MTSTGQLISIMLVYATRVIMCVRYLGQSEVDRGLKDVKEQRDQLYRKLEVLKAQGIELGPKLSVLKTGGGGDLTGAVAGGSPAGLAVTAAANVAAELLYYTEERSGEPGQHAKSQNASPNGTVNLSAR